MIGHRFDYACPGDSQEAALVLARSSQVSVLGGGTALLPRMGRGEESPSTILDLRRLGLSYVRRRGTCVAIGARSTYDEVAGSEIVRQELPLLATMASGITGGRSITSQGTLGGSACYANPSSDVPACLAAMGAVMHLTSVAATRTVPAASFFLDAYLTARRSDEFLSEITFDVARTQVGAGYHKLKFSGSSWPIVTAACVLRAAGSDLLDVSLSIGAAAPVPITVDERIPARNADFGALAARAAGALGAGWTDELADASYRLAVAPEIARRAIQVALRAALGEANV